MVLPRLSHEALFAAVRSGDAATIRALLADAEASGTSLAALAGEAATHVAAEAEKEEIVRLLLSLYDIKAATVRTRGDLDAFYLTAMHSHTGRAPDFDGTHYAAWRHKMKIYLTAIHPSVWRIVETGYTVKDIGSPSTKEEQNQHTNAVAANAIFNALSPQEYNRVCGLESAKEIWNTLQLAHGGTSRAQVLHIKLLMGTLERFTMEEHETPKEMYSRLIHIVNEIKGLGSKEMTDNFVVERMLRAITPRNPVLATIIPERKDFSKLTPHDVLAIIHDCMNQSSSSKKYITPKARKEAEESSSEEESEDEHEYEMKCFRKRLREILGKPKESNSKRSRYESSETGPLVVNGPNKKNKDNDEKRNEHLTKGSRSKRHKKSQKGQAHIGEEWGSNDYSADSDEM